MQDSPSDGGRRPLRAKLPELLVEGVSVAFAVLLALGVDEWRENRSNLELAARAEVQTLYEDARDAILPHLVRVDTFGDLVTGVYARSEASGFELEPDDEDAPSADAGNERRRYRGPAP